MLGTTASGLAGLSVGCPRPAPAVERSFVGQDPARGHLLRDGAIASAPVSDRVSCDVLIVGGGAAGMAAAWRLQRAGESNVHVLELEPELGGTARGGQTPRSRYPMGAHYLPTPHHEFTALQTLLADLGVLTRRAKHGPEYDPRVVCRAPLERHRFRGKWEEGLYPGAGQSPEEEAQWVRWRAHLAELDKRRGADGRRLFTLPVADSSTELRDLDQISMATYLDRLGLTSWRLRWAVDYACRDDYGCTIEQASAFAGLHHYLCRGLDNDEHERFILTWPQGNARLVELMAEAARLEDRVHRDTVAFQIDPDSGTVTAYDYGAQRQRVFEAKQVLWAAPRFILPRVLPPGRDPMERDALTYSPWLVASVELSQRPGGIGAALSWDNVPVHADNLGYVVATHLEPLTQRNAEGTVITYYQPMPADDVEGLRQRRTDLLAGSLDHWCDHVGNELEAMHPGIGATVRRMHIARWGHAMIRPVPGVLFGPGRATAAAPVGRIQPCSTDVAGLPLFEEAFCAGVRAAELAVARLGRPVSDPLS